MSFSFKTVTLLACMLAAFDGSLGASARRERPEAFLVYPVEKIRPDSRPAVEIEKTVHLAGGEYEPVLFGVFNPGPEQRSLISVRVRQPPKSPLGIGLYRVGYIPVTKVSRWFSATYGQWPDPLVPIQPSAGRDGEETLFSFEKPVSVPAGENRTFLLELYLPRGASLLETLSLSALLSDGTDLSLELVVKGWRFDLPRVPSMATSFGFSADLVAKKHGELSDQAFSPDKLSLDYIRLLSRFRLSVFSHQMGEITAVRGPDGSLSFDWSGFDGLEGALLDGALSSDAPPATSFMTPSPPSGLSDEEQKEFYRQLAEHARSNGWLERMFSYLPDEPLRSEFPAVREAAAWIKESDPLIRTLVTRQYTKELEGAVDIWCPDIWAIGDSVPFMPLAARWPYKFFLDWQWNPPSRIYRELQAAGKTAWLYSCNSAAFLDYPNMFLDSEASSQRVIPWLAFRYGFSGFLFWHTVFAYGQSGNPWDSQYLLFTNGDGNLLYPGIPGMPDIAAHEPVPSLRLEILRDGLEDYEYLALLSQRGREAQAEILAMRAAMSSLRWQHDAGELLALREEAGLIIEKAGLDGP